MADLKTYASIGYESTLDTSLGPGVTTVNVTSTVGSPAVPCYLTIDPGSDAKREVVRATAKTATTFTIVRAQDGTSDVEHDPNAVIASVPVSAQINDLHDRVDAGDTALTTHEGAADPHPGYLTAAEGNAAYVGVAGDTMTGALLLPDGTAAAPSVAFANDPDTGLYQATLDRVTVACGGAFAYQFSGTFLLPEPDNSKTLGNSSRRWSDGYIVRLLSGDGTAAAPALTFQSDTDTGIYRDTADSFRVTLGGSQAFAFTTAAYYPVADNTKTLGTSALRWVDVWAVDGTINTSDETQKDTVVDTPLGLDFVKAVRPIEFKWKGGSRTHVGFSAQQVAEALTAVGAGDRAIYIDPAVGAAQKEQAGPPAQEPDEDDEDYAERVAEWHEDIAAEKAAPKGLRYSELIAPLYRAVQEQQAIIEQQAATIADLVARVEALEAR